MSTPITDAEIYAAIQEMDNACINIRITIDFHNCMNSNWGGSIPEQTRCIPAKLIPPGVLSACEFQLSECGPTPKEPFEVSVDVTMATMHHKLTNNELAICWLVNTMGNQFGGGSDDDSDIAKEESDMKTQKEENPLVPIFADHMKPCPTNKWAIPLIGEINIEMCTSSMGGIPTVIREDVNTFVLKYKTKTPASD